ncbi:MAG: hypothetical protein GTO14_14930 [Anaerolineales bacterium]|nr:hypothetical protein [Anaerolineales bacterium]
MSHDIILLRHGLSTANRDQIVQGQIDFALAEEGHHQSQLLAQYWASMQVHFDKIISSPLARAKETAQIIGEILNSEIVLDAIWMERRLGAAQGVDYETVRAWYEDRPLPSPYEPSFEDGESAWDLFLRAGEAVQSVLQMPAGSYLVVSHGAFLNAALRVIIGLAPASGRILPVRFRFDNTGFAELNFDKEMARWTVIRSNATPHIHQEGNST